MVPESASTSKSPNVKLALYVETSDGESVMLNVPVVETKGIHKEISINVSSDPSKYLMFFEREVVVNGSSKLY